MIFTPNSPGSQETKCYDVITNQPLDLIIEVDTITGEAWEYRKDDYGSIVWDYEYHRAKRFKHPNLVRVEVPDDYKTCFPDTYKEIA